MKTRWSQLLYRISIFFFTGLVPATAWAADPTSSLRASIIHNLKKAATVGGLYKSGNENISPFDLFGLYLNALLGFAGVIFVVQVIHGVFLWMTASGNEEQVRKAQSKIVNG